MRGKGERRRKKTLKRSIVRAFPFSSVHDVCAFVLVNAGACIERTWRFDIFERG